MKQSIYSLKVTTIQGIEHRLEEYSGKVILIVNTASQCGFTKQFLGLESLYENYKSQGLVILGFPCNQFGQQDPDSNEQILRFCEKNYGVSFPMFRKLKVNGEDADPLFKQLKQDAPEPSGGEPIKWNFTKFLINKEGIVEKRFASEDEPSSLEQAIKAQL